MSDLVTPCHGAKLLLIDNIEIMCDTEGCGNEWMADGTASEWNMETPSE